MPLASDAGEHLSKDPFRIRDHVPEFDAIVDDIIAASARTRDDLPMIAEVSYGSGHGETLDLFFPDLPRKGLPVHMFIHGGYWRMFSKSDYSCIANTVTKAGAIAVIVDYALMPRYRMALLIDQMRRAKQWVVEHIEGYGGDPSLLTMSGHSAGAHLATFLIHPDDPVKVNSALLLGGIYDLKPLQRSFLQGEIALTDDEVAQFNPLDHFYDRGCSILLAVGEEETPPFHLQAEAFARSLREQGAAVSLKTLARCNHMSSVRELGLAGTEVTNFLADVIHGTGIRA